MRFTIAMIKAKGRRAAARSEAGAATRATRPVRAFWGDKRAASAVEFAMVSIPFIFIILFIVQMGIYYLAQSSLDAGVLQTADWLVGQYNCPPPATVCTATPTFTLSDLKTKIYAMSGGVIKNDARFVVDFQQLSALTSAPVAIGGAFDSGAANAVLALRAQGTIITFMPGFGGFATVRSSALVRRQSF